MMGMETIPTLPRSRPEDEGVPSRALIRLVDTLGGLDEMHSLTVLRHGAVVAEGWWDPYRPELRHELFSLSKTVTAMAAGFARAEGLLDFDARVVDFFPGEVPGDPSANLAAMRVRDLLTMRTGHEEDSMGRTLIGDDWVRNFLALPVPREPGTWFVYDTGASYVLSAILARVTGERLLDYVRPRLLDPLGIVGATWEQSPQGIDIGGFGLSIRTVDIAALGVLLAQDGEFGGRRVLPEGWVAEASADGGPPVPQLDVPPDWLQGYGHQMWLCQHGAFRGDGSFGQFCIVVPDADLVFAATAGTTQMQEVMDAVWAVLPELADGPLPADDAAVADLEARLAGLRLPAPGVERAGAHGDLPFVGRDLRLARTWKGISRLRVDPGPLEDLITARIAGLDVLVRAGHGTWVEQTLVGPWGPHGTPAATGMFASVDRPAPGQWRLSLRPYPAAQRRTVTIRTREDGTAVMNAEVRATYEAPSTGDIVLR